MPKYRVFVNATKKWTGTAKDPSAAVHAAAKKAGQIWKVRLDTPLHNSPMGGKIFLHTDHDVPDMITDIRGLKEVPLIHDFRQLEPGQPLRTYSIGEFLAKDFPEGPTEIFGASD